MGGISKFDIVFNNPTGVFYAGQVVDGNVIVEVGGHTMVKGIKIEFEGKGKVEWKERRMVPPEEEGGEEREEYEEIEQKEKYFEYENKLYHPDGGQEATMFPPGQYMYPFGFTIPANVPSCYKSSYGEIKYKMKAKVDIPDEDDSKVKKKLTVVALVDLNADATAITPGRGQDSKELGCLCCKSGPISASFTTDRSGYIPGEPIIINAEVNNASDRRMDASRVLLYMHVSYHAEHRTKTERREIAKLSHGGIEPHETDTWAGEQLIVPSVPATTMPGTSNIIRVHYTLQFEVDPSGMSFDLEIPLNLLIGTIPLRQYMPTWYPQYPEGQAITTQPGGPPSAYPPEQFVQNGQFMMAVPPNAI